MKSNLDSEMSRWIHSNEPPPDHELGLMQHELDAQLERLSTLNAILRKIPIPALLEEHTQLEESIESFKLVLHPNRRIPPEILHHIFRLSMRQEFASLDPRSPPLVFTRVCRAWRRVALNMRELWSTLCIFTSINSKGFNAEEVRFEVDGVRRWLARARQKPIVISLNSPPEYDFKNEVEYSLPKAILDHSLFIRELHFRTSDPLLEVMIGGQVRYRRSWPLLEKVAIHIANDSETDLAAHWIAQYHNPIWEAPKLKSVSWAGVSADFLRLTLNWAQLVELRLSGSYKFRGKVHACTYGGGNIRHMLQATPNLETLEISTNASYERLPNDWFGVDLPRNSETVLRHLKTLILEETRRFPFGASPHFFSSLQLPALITLKYRMSTYRGSHFPTTDQHPLVLFLQSQRDPVLIKIWDICTKSLSPLGMVECLKHMPRLSNLSVSWDGNGTPYALEGGEWNVSPGDWILEALYSHGQASLCPSLQVMMFQYCEFTLDGLRAFVDGRTQLAQESDGGRSKFVNMNAIFVFLKEVRPVFVPRDPASCASRLPNLLAQCELEEDLKAAGTEAFIQFLGGGSEAGHVT